MKLNFNLNYEGFEENLVKSRALHGGIQYQFKFENSYGASVVKHDFSDGHQMNQWELGVIKWDDENNWDLYYCTPVTDDIVGYLTDEDVRDFLKQIKELK